MLPKIIEIGKFHKQNGFGWSWESKKKFKSIVANGLANQMSMISPKSVENVSFFVPQIGDII